MKQLYYKGEATITVFNGNVYIAKEWEQSATIITFITPEEEMIRCCGQWLLEVKRIDEQGW